MANSSIARPYALAAFECARSKQQLAEWKAFLTAASFMVTDAQVARLLANPEVQHTELYTLFHGVLASLLDAERNNFLLLLAQNKRFSILPAMAEVFNEYLAKLEKISTVKVITAIDTSEQYRQKLAQALTKRLNSEVTLQCEVNPAILGGAIIHIGDSVIDGSISGKLSRLLEISLR
jgi:F-type H+-transporting ATPase subunit delta